MAVTSHGVAVSYRRPRDLLRASVVERTHMTTGDDNVRPFEKCGRRNPSALLPDRYDAARGAIWDAVVACVDPKRRQP